VAHRGRARSRQPRSDSTGTTPPRTRLDYGPGARARKAGRTIRRPSDVRDRSLPPRRSSRG
jgi:hypothetical protein